MCLGIVAAACTPDLHLGRNAASPEVETWIVSRDPRVASAVRAPTAPALALRASGSATDPEVPPLAHTRITATVVGPITTIERTKAYVTPHAHAEAFVSFTPPGAPARQDYLVRLPRRTFVILVRDPAEARDLAHTAPHATLLDAGADGRVTVPAGTIASTSAELTVETTGLVPWHDGAYELTVPRVPEGDVTLAVDAYGPGPIVVVNSPSHAIDATPDSVEHLRVAVREPATLRDDDFVLRYRVDPADRPGAIVVESDGAEQVVALLVHPLETGHEPVAASDVTVDWNGAPITDVRPAEIGRMTAGTPLVVLARARGAVSGPIVVRARVGRETRTITLEPSDVTPATGFHALASLWARSRGGVASTR